MPVVIFCGTIAVVCLVVGLVGAVIDPMKPNDIEDKWWQYVLVVPGFFLFAAILYGVIIYPLIFYARWVNDNF